MSGVRGEGPPLPRAWRFVLWVGAGILMSAVRVRFNVAGGLYMFTACVQNHFTTPHSRSRGSGSRPHRSRFHASHSHNTIVPRTPRQPRRPRTRSLPPRVTAPLPPASRAPSPDSPASAPSSRRSPAPLYAAEASRPPRPHQPKRAQVLRSLRLRIGPSSSA